MDISLQKRISSLESTVNALNSQIQELTNLVDALTVPPTDKTGEFTAKNQIRAGDINENMQHNIGAPVLWNTSEMNFVSLKTLPPNPSSISGAKGFNKHTHSRFSGGALIKDGLEIVDYDLSNYPNVHSQGYWTSEPPIKTQTNSNGQQVLKIGPLDLVFNPNTKKWGVAALEIDVAKVNLVRRDADGNIMLDSGGSPMSSPMYNDSPAKTSVVWDASAKCWRFYAVYAPDSSQN